MDEAMIGIQEVTQPLSYSLDELRADVRPLRGQVEELILALRTKLLAQGLADPVLTAALDLCYTGEATTLTVPFPIEIEDAAVCAADPRPLDNQALREAVSAFHAAYTAQHGVAWPKQQVQVVRLRIRAEAGEGSDSGRD
ncbi:MAG: hypothetical protein DYG89_01385 [Caldilinea sp. CFX5]|nr:hypothetical protein [Caldilinea sp. CFX5]